MALGEIPSKQTDDGNLSLELRHKLLAIQARHLGPQKPVCSDIDLADMPMQEVIRYRAALAEAVSAAESAVSTPIPKGDERIHHLDPAHAVEFDQVRRIPMDLRERISKIAVIIPILPLSVAELVTKGVSLEPDEPMEVLLQRNPELFKTRSKAREVALYPGQPFSRWSFNSKFADARKAVSQRASDLVDRGIDKKVNPVMGNLADCIQVVMHIRAKTGRFILGDKTIFTDEDSSASPDYVATLRHKRISVPFPEDPKRQIQTYSDTLIFGVGSAHTVDARVGCLRLLEAR